MPGGSRRTPSPLATEVPVRGSHGRAIGRERLGRAVLVSGLLSSLSRDQEEPQRSPRPHGPRAWGGGAGRTRAQGGGRDAGLRRAWGCLLHGSFLPHRACPARGAAEPVFPGPWAERVSQ